MATATLSVALPASRIFAEQTTAFGMEGYIAGTGNPTLTTGDAPDSICPSGWRLPGKEGDKSYYNLIDTVYLSHEQAVWTGSNLDTPLVSAPTNFIKNCYYNGTLCSLNEGYSWSGRPSPVYLQIAPGGIRTQHVYWRYSYGFSLRCLAR